MTGWPRSWLVLDHSGHCHLSVEVRSPDEAWSMARLLCELLRPDLVPTARWSVVHVRPEGVHR